MKIKKILSLVLVIAMLMGMCAVPTFAEDDEGGLTVTLVPTSTNVKQGTTSLRLSVIINNETDAPVIIGGFQIRAVSSSDTLIGNNFIMNDTLSTKYDEEDNPDKYGWSFEVGTKGGVSAAGGGTDGTTSKRYELGANSSLTLGDVRFTSTTAPVGSYTFSLENDPEGSPPFYLAISDGESNYPNVDFNSTATVNIVSTGVALSQSSVVADGTNEVTVRASAFDSSVTEVTTESAWSIAPADGNVSIGTNTGLITVAAKATAQTYTITAEKTGAFAGGENTATAELVVTRNTPEAKEVTVSGAGTIAVPLLSPGTDATATYTATVTDQYGATIESPTVVWSIVETLEGVSIDSSTGVVTVTTAAINNDFTSAVSFTVKAVSGGKEATKTVELTREAAAVTTVTVAPGTGMTIPASGAAATQTFTATVTDQYGKAMNDQTIAWTIVKQEGGAVAGITIDANGVVSVATSAKDAITNSETFTITATVSGVPGTATIAISRAEAVATDIAISDGQEDILVPADNASAIESAAFTAAITNQYGAPYTGSVTWSLTSAPAGVSINSSTGVVTVTNAAKATITDTTGISYTVTATFGSVTKTATITVKRDTPAATSVVIYNDAAGTNATGGADTLVIPTTDTPNMKQYYAKTYDQYGEVMSDSHTWSLNADTNVTHDGSGKVTVTKAATKDTTYTLTATGANAKTASVAITVKDIDVNWAAIVAKSSITYGDSKASAFTTLPATGTATAVGTLSGTFAILNPTDILTAGSKTITVEFTVTTAGDYAGVKITKDYPITVAPKAITVTVTAASREYGAVNPTFAATAAAGQLVGDDAIAGLNLNLITEADENSPAGTYDVTGTTNGNSNYTVTITGTGKLTVTKAALTLSGTASFADILANDPSNDSLSGLILAVQEGIPTLDATYANRTTTLNTAWSAQSVSFNPKGGTYTLTATLTPTDTTNFTYTGNTTVTFTVKPVRGTYTYSPATLTKAKAEVTAAADLAALGLPATLAVTYDNNVSGDTYNITGWNYTLAQLQAINVSTADASRDMIPTVDFPAWATITDLDDLKTVLTITSKYPVDVTLANPANITYKEPLDLPVPQQVAIANGTDTGAVTWEYEYSTSENGTYTATQPTNAGTYYVRAKLVSATHSGTSPAATFTINKATAEISFTDNKTTETLFGDTKTFTIPAESTNDDSDAQFMYSSSNTAVATVNSAGKVTAVANGTATITVSMIATDNFNAAANATFTVTAIPNPITGVTVGGTDAATISAVLTGRTIKVTGLGETYTLSIITETGTTDGAIADGKVIVTLDADPTQTVEYTVDISGLKGKPDKVDNVDEIEPTVDKGEYDGESDLDVLEDSRSSGLLAAIADIIVREGNEAEDSIDIETFLVMEVVEYTENDSLILDIKPFYTVDDGDPKPATINGPVTITIKLPAGIIAENVKVLHKGVGITPDNVNTTNNTITFTVTNFSEFEFRSDTRTATATFEYADGTEIVKTYTLADVGTQLPTDSKSGSTFDGWQISEAGVAYKGTFDEDMLDAFDLADTGSGITLTPKFTANSGSIPTGPSKDKEEEEWENPYVDVNENLWFYEAVQFVTENKLMNGVGDNRFNPDGTTSRAMVATILWRLAGEPTAAAHDFTDVLAGEWYSTAVAWAAANGIVEGYGDGSFKPNASITREQLVTMLYRYIKHTGGGFVGEWMFLLPFSDSADISDWAYEAVSFCTMHGIIGGRTDGTFDPSGTATRAETATILMNFLDK